MSEALKPVLDDGLLRFDFRCRGETTPHEIDVLILRLTCEECEQTHGLQVKEGSYVATAAFLTDLAGRIAALGVAGCTPSLAYQLWGASVAHVEALKKNMSETPSSPSGSTSSPADESPEPGKSES